MPPVLASGRPRVTDSAQNAPVVVAGAFGCRGSATLAPMGVRLRECTDHEDCRRCDVTDPCPCCGLRYEDGEWVPTSRRFFWWAASGLTYRWQLLCLSGWRGGDENCNRTIGFRLPGGMLFVCLNVPLRQQPHDDCRMPA